MTDDNPVPDEPLYVGIDWNDYEYLETTTKAKIALYRGEFRVERWVRANAGLRLIDVNLITGFHRTLFEGVWPEFAGRLRGLGNGYIHRNVNFGNYRGTDAADVPDQVERLASFTRGPIRDLDARLGSLSPDYVDESLRNIAARLHCELVRIHPFVNGNGRTARACVNCGLLLTWWCDIRAYRTRVCELHRSSIWISIHPLGPTTTKRIPRCDQHVLATAELSTLRGFPRIIARAAIGWAA